MYSEIGRPPRGASLSAAAGAAFFPQSFAGYRILLVVAGDDVCYIGVYIYRERESVDRTIEFLSR